jgi:hypothetical protein
MDDGLRSRLLQQRTEACSVCEVDCRGRNSRSRMGALVQTNVVAIDGDDVVSLGR